MRSFFTLGVFISLLLIIFYIPRSSADVKAILPTTDEVNNDIKVKDRILDKLNGIPVYYNPEVFKNTGRHLSDSGYNFGLKWQCVEFVKRYYYQRFNHKMPDTYGHAKDFFDKEIKQGWNPHRGLMQSVNGGRVQIKKDAILIFDGNSNNPYGHIGIVSKVDNDSIEVTQQNWGTTTRMSLPLMVRDHSFYVDYPDVLGWLTID
jgi:surface antigen